MPHHHLDARNLLCPVPLLKTASKVKELAVGDTLEIICTDSTVLDDVPAWCKMKGHQLLTIEKNAIEIKLIIQIKK